MLKKRFLGTLQFGATPITYALVSYYEWRYAPDRGTAMRAMLTEFAQRDPKFNIKDFLYFVDKKIRPKIQSTPWATETLDRDIDILINKRQTSDTIIFHEARGVDENAPEKKTKRKRSAVKKSGSIARSSVRAILRKKGE